MRSLPPVAAYLFLPTVVVKLCGVMLVQKWPLIIQFSARYKRLHCVNFANHTWIVGDHFGSNPCRQTPFVYGLDYLSA